MGTTVQGDLLSSSYCVRLGRVRFRVENKATRWGSGGARGRQQTEEVSTYTLREHPDLPKAKLLQNHHEIVASFICLYEPEPILLPGNMTVFYYTQAI